MQHLRNYNHPLFICISSVLHPFLSASQVEVHFIRFSSVSHPLLAYYESHTKCVFTMKIMILDVGVQCCATLHQLIIHFSTIRISFACSSHSHPMRFSSASHLFLIRISFALIRFSSVSHSHLHLIRFLSASQVSSVYAIRLTAMSCVGL